MDLKVGDIVKLKSGGPKMTVNRVGPTEDSDDIEYVAKDEVQTVWFSDEAGCFKDIFGVEALVKVDP